MLGWTVNPKNIYCRILVASGVRDEAEAASGARAEAEAGDGNKRLFLYELKEKNDSWGITQLARLCLAFMLIVESVNQ